MRESFVGFLLLKRCIKAVVRTYAAYHLFVSRKSKRNNRERERERERLANNRASSRFYIQNKTEKPDVDHAKRADRGDERRPFDYRRVISVIDVIGTRAADVLSTRSSNSVADRETNK